MPVRIGLPHVLLLLLPLLPLLLLLLLIVTLLLLLLLLLLRLSLLLMLPLHGVVINISQGCPVLLGGCGMEEFMTISTNNKGL